MVKIDHVKGNAPVFCRRTDFYLPAFPRQRSKTRLHHRSANRVENDIRTLSVGSVSGLFGQVSPRQINHSVRPVLLSDRAVALATNRPNHARSLPSTDLDRRTSDAAGCTDDE